jgi:hypothetical protein
MAFGDEMHYRLDLLTRLDTALVHRLAFGIFVALGKPNLKPFPAMRLS